MTETHRPIKISAAFYAMLRIGLGLSLCLAGYSKFFPLDSLLVGSQFLIPPSIVSVIAVIEILIGVGLIFFSNIRLVWYAAIALFTIFAGIQVLNLAFGQSSCGCTSLIEASVVQMLVFDLICIGVLVTPMFGTLHPMGERCPILASESGSWPAIFRSFALIVLVATTVMIPWFGSASVFSNSVVGFPVAAVSPRIFAGEISAEVATSVQFELRNLTSSQLTIVGARSSCSCTALEDLPIVIEPGRVQSITMTVVGRTSEVGKIASYQSALKIRELVDTYKLEVFAKITPELVE